MRRPQPVRATFDKTGKSIGNGDGDKRQAEKDYEHHNQVKHRRYNEVYHKGTFRMMISSNKSNIPARNHSGGKNHYKMLFLIININL
jgi:hypothetical protein